VAFEVPGMLEQAARMNAVNDIIEAHEGGANDEL
jgi:hypothetical protein